ncbi:MAG: sialidase family protein [Candidatus Dormibacteria bacterium]
MSVRRRQLLMVIPAIGALLTYLLVGLGGHGGARVAHGFNINRMSPGLRAHVSGLAEEMLGGQRGSRIDSETGAGVPDAGPGTTTPGSGGANYIPTANLGCSGSSGSNIKVNQNCLNITDKDLQGRGQAQNETFVAHDANNPGHMVATYNDYRRGDGGCGGSYSLDEGATWRDTILPFSFTRGGKNFPGFSRQYWSAGGDTSVAFDTRGNAYFTCQVFNRGNPTSTNPDQSSAFLVFRSTGNAGASWNFPGRYVTAFNDNAGDGNFLLDKQLLTVDNHVGSPFADRVYVTWTTFDNRATAGLGGTAFIYGAYSKDYGQTFSAPVLISQDSALCSNPFNTAPVNSNSCDNNQFSQPFTDAAGNLYVTWSNFNTGGAAPNPAAPGTNLVNNPFQVLVAKSVDGGVTFGPATKVSEYYELPDCGTYQGKNGGRACVPEKGSSKKSFSRASNYPVGAVNPQNPNQVSISIGSYINGHSNPKFGGGCTYTGTDQGSGAGLYTGVKAGGCNNDVILSVSNDGGATFPDAAKPAAALSSVTQDTGQANTDQWFQWLAYNPAGKLWVSYYDRQYGTDATTGFSDFSLSGSVDGVTFKTERVTTSSMPPPTQFSGLFWGDYTGMTATAAAAFPVWSDTRSPDLVVCPNSATDPGNPPRLCTIEDANGVANDQDIQVARAGLPPPPPPAPAAETSATLPAASNNTFPAIVPGLPKAGVRR